MLSHAASRSLFGFFEKSTNPGRLSLFSSSAATRDATWATGDAARAIPDGPEDACDTQNGLHNVEPFLIDFH
jgi:hypothetical protein